MLHCHWTVLLWLPAVDIAIPEGTTPAESRTNPIGDAVGLVDGKVVGVLLFQSGGFISLLEVYDLHDIGHPYGMPDLDSLRPFQTNSSAHSS
ncbi:MAG: hypothetical protein NVS9B15_23130 [Acidobacteriaceae bacterium]